MKNLIEFIGYCLAITFFVGLVVLLIAASIGPALALTYFLFKLAGVM